MKLTSKQKNYHESDPRVIKAAHRKVGAAGKSPKEITSKQRL